MQRLIEELSHECTVIAPSLIPRRPGERVKTNRRDAVKLARLFRAGELTEIWTPDEAHEAMRDHVRAREAAVKDRTRKRQEIRSFPLRPCLPLPTVQTALTPLPVRTPSYIALLPPASYSAVRKPRGSSGTVSASARRALPLKRRSG